MRRRTKRKIKLVIVMILLISAVFGCIYSGYKILTWRKENENTSENIKEIQEVTKIEVEEDKTLKVDYTEIMKRNSDTVGWIRINNTNIDYPIVKAPDNDYYLTHSFDKSKNSAGWIFMDYRNSGHTLDNNTIIYGHNRKDGSMFGSLKKALNKDWIKNEDNRIIKYTNLDGSYLFEIFSLYLVSETDDYVNLTITDELLKTFKSRSAYRLNVDVKTTDKILTLQTCQGSAKKLVVHAKLINNEEEKEEYIIH